ncbi:MAG: hypothetical protein KKB81_00150 [Candidatus Margulisbacteria bacterium]|nr:hypothetical protein [Candidatus Margulisiibacteriota bacterium]MBU1022366.1 hypothetical protein [Candidatus Margulisiibacteriota bacterium]MBU1729082.1 hypothetical protein [Candidatus Margulisiibacteriota bacterium]MBU1954497.1 hypothetical protein [Candidatus Margulisiibacteriota bacterium]
MTVLSGVDIYNKVNRFFGWPPVTAAETLYCNDASSQSEAHLQKVCDLADFPFCNCDSFGTYDFIADPAKAIELSELLSENGEDEFAAELLTDSIFGLYSMLEDDPTNAEAAYSLAKLMHYLGNPALARDIYFDFMIELCLIEEPTSDDIDNLQFAVQLIDECDLIEEDEAQVILSRLGEEDIKDAAVAMRIKLYQAILAGEPDQYSNTYLDAQFGLFNEYYLGRQFDLARIEYDALLRILEGVVPYLAAEYRFRMCYLVSDYAGAFAAIQDLPAFSQNGELTKEEAKQKVSDGGGFQSFRLPLSEIKAKKSERLIEIDRTGQDFEDLVEGVALSIDLGDEVAAWQMLEAAQEINPYSSFLKGLELDLLIWLGDYDLAMSLIETYRGNFRMDSYYHRVFLNTSAAQNGARAKRLAEGRYDRFIRRKLNETKEKVKYFPQSYYGWLYISQASFMRLDQLETARAAFEEAEVILADAIAAGAGEIDGANNAYDFLQGMLNRIRLFGRERAQLDGKPVRLVDYRPGSAGSMDSTAELPAGEEMQQLLASNMIWYYVENGARMREAIVSFINATRETNPRWGFSETSVENLAILSLDEVIMLAARVTECMLDYDSLNPRDVVNNLDPIDLKVSLNLYSSGVCENYLALFAAIFESIKEINPNLVNAYADFSFASSRGWNTVFVVRENDIIGFVLDVTQDDNDHVFGNDMGGLRNYRVFR